EGRRFAGDLAHAYRNSGAQTAHFHSLIHYPKEKAAGI
ncbi:XRE family transcriptional regulator, partial [Raoultella planticola]